MKAVITLTADARGVQAGVNAALHQMERLQRVAADIRGLFVAQILGDFLRQGMNQALGELNRLKDLGSTFSMEGAMAAAQLQMERMRSDMALGKAFGPASARADEITGQALREVTSYLVANKDQIGEALVNLAVFAAAASHALGELTLFVSRVINTISAASDFRFSEARANVAGAAEYIGMGGTVAGIQSYLMDYTPAGRILQLLERKLGGN